MGSSIPNGVDWNHSGRCHPLGTQLDWNILKNFTYPVPLRGGWNDWELYSFLSLSLHLYLYLSIFVSVPISIISIPGSSPSSNYLCHYSLVEPLLLCIEDGSKEGKYGNCVSPEVTHSFLCSFKESHRTSPNSRGEETNS